MLQLPGAQKNQFFKSQPIKFWENKQAFKWAARVELLKLAPSKLGDEILLKLYVTKGDFDQKEFIGQCTVPWKICIDEPNMWAVKKSAPLSDPDGNSKMLPKDGKIQLMSKYIPIGKEASNFNSQGEPSKKLASDLKKKPEAKTPKVKFGTLKVHVKQGENFEVDVRHKLVLRIDGTIQREETSVINDSDPTWDEV